jgi:hypothetical protein
MAVIALGTKNPSAAFRRGVESLNLPYGEAAEHFKALIHENEPKLASFFDGLITSKQINGQVAGNPDLRKLIGCDQIAISEVMPDRKAAAPIDFDNVIEQKPSRSESGETLEAQVRKVLEWSGLEFVSSVRQPMLKLFGEVAEPDFTVTEGVRDQRNELRDGFYVECKNRPTGRVPDSDLIYSMWCICNFYKKPTIVVLEASEDRLLSGAHLFLQKQREAKAAGMLKAIYSVDQFRGFVQNQIGRAA